MFNSTISMLRVADARKSQQFYVDKLGFQTSWEYDPGDGEPIFVEVMRDNVAFHLSEHEGDGPTGIQLYINVDDAKALYVELCSKGVVIVEELYEAEWDHNVFAIQDPDGNTLRIGSPM